MRLTLPQRDVYFEQLIYPDDPIYNIGAKILIKGRIVYKILNAAYIELINQHDAYRSIIERNGEDVQMQVLAEHISELGFVDFSADENPEKRANEYMQKNFARVFDFDSKELLHKFVLVRVGDAFHYLFSMYHHIITDGWGTSLMFQRLVKNYNELVEFGKIETQYLFSYEEFVSDDSIYETSEDFQRDKSYWKEKFKVLPDPLFSKISGVKKVNKSRREEYIIKRSVYNQIEGVASKLRSSPFHIILAILYLYFGRRHQNKDFAIGVPVLNRGKAIFKKTVGLFMGISALRIPLDYEDTFEDLATKIKKQLRQDYRHQRFPIGKLVQELDLFQNKDRLFNLTLSYEKQDYSVYFKDTYTRVIPLTHESERVALALYIREFNNLDDVKIDFDYNVSYFSQESIQQVVEHIGQLISEVVKDPNKKIHKYCFVSSAEEERMLRQFNQTELPYPKESSFLSYFRDQIKVNAELIAVRDDCKSYTYHELDLYSGRIANYIDQNLENNQKSIAVLLDRSADLIVALLGILKSGKAFIPLDPSFPKNRLNHIIEHSGVNHIIASPQTNEKWTKGVSFVDLEALLSFEPVDTKNTYTEVSGGSPAYIIYTSGSTGEPKGVVVEHASLLNFLLSMLKKPKIVQKDILFSVTTHSFDISILEFFAPLISGATLYIAAKDVLADPLTIIKKIRQVKPTIIQATPSFYQMLFNANWDGESKLKILCGGDLLSQSLAKSLIKTCGEVWNMYGPTETTIWSSIKELKTATEACIIGKPIHNTKFYILDEFLQPLPTGFMGTLYIGGEGLARGYFENEPLTRKKFVENPFAKGEKMYNTGDLGRWNSDGEVEFLGRIDNQVKIRGYRIELAEIESKLNQISTVRSSVVVSKKDNNHESSLMAFIQPSGSHLDTEHLIEELKKELPEYMVPYVIIPLDEFPLTPNMKIDRKLLSQFDSPTVRIESQFREPTTDIEKQICKFYQKVLGIENIISVSDNFFVLGGHSLSAVRLISLIEKTLCYQVPLKAIFEYPTVQSLANYLENLKPQEFRPIKRIPYRPSYRLTSSQYSIWLASQHPNRSKAYNISAVYRIKGAFKSSLLEQALLKIINKYEILRTNFIEVEGFPHQKIKHTEETLFKLDQVIEDEISIQKSFEEYTHKEFDLANQILLRVGLFELKGKETFLVFTTHHIIMDGWSLEILIGEFIKNYKELSLGIDPKEDKLLLQFKDYAAWHDNLLKENSIRNKEFWTEYLNNYNWKFLIPHDFDLTETEFLGTMHHFLWKRDFLDGVNEVILKQHVTSHTFLITCFTILIHKMYGHKDICLGIVNSGRAFLESESQLGMFVKTLPLRVKMDLEETFASLLKRTHNNLLAIDEFQDIPEDIKETFRIDVLFVMQNPAFQNETIEINKQLTLNLEIERTNFSRLPLLVNFNQSKDLVKGYLSYDTGIYANETIRLVILKFEQLLKQVSAKPNVNICDIDIALAFEKENPINLEFNF